MNPTGPPERTEDLNINAITEGRRLPDAHPQPVVGDEELRERLRPFVCRPMQPPTDGDPAVAKALQEADERKLDHVMQLVQAHTEAAVREAKKSLLNQLNNELFYSTTQPDGQFIKDTINAKLDAMLVEEYPPIDRLTKGGN